MTNYKFFLAHAKNDPDDIINAWRDHLVVLLNTYYASEPATAEVTAGRDDFAARAAALGGWAEWTASVATGVDWRGEPIFDGMVVPVGDDPVVVGKATGQMLQAALAAGRAVFAYAPGLAEFYPVLGLDVIRDGKSWKDWATLRIDRA